MSNAGPTFTKDGLARFDAAMTWHAAEGGVPGLVAGISRHGERHIHAAGAPTLGSATIGPDAIFRIASITKPVTAVATMINAYQCPSDPKQDRLNPLFGPTNYLGSSGSGTRNSL